MEFAGTVVVVKPAADPYYLMATNGLAAAIVSLAAEVVVAASEVLAFAATDSTLHISHQPLPHETEQEVWHSDCTLHAHLKSHQ